MILFDDATVACSCSHGNSSTIRILRITNRGAEVRNEFSVQSSVLSLCVVELAGERSAAGVVALATGCQDGIVRIWRHISGSLLLSLNALQGHPVSLLLVAAANHTRRVPCVIAGSSSGALCIWDLAGNLIAPVMILPTHIVDMHLLPASDKLFVFGGDRTVRTYRVSDMNLLSTITLSNLGITRALVSELPGDSKSRDIIIAGAVDGTISVHAQLHLLIAWQAHKGEVACMCSTPWSSDSTAFNRRCFIISIGGKDLLSFIFLTFHFITPL
jgi:WD40 repeat protein